MQIKLNNTFLHAFKANKITVIIQHRSRSTRQTFHVQLFIQIPKTWKILLQLERGGKFSIATVTPIEIRSASIHNHIVLTHLICDFKF